MVTRYHGPEGQFATGRSEQQRRERGPSIGRQPQHRISRNIRAIGTCRVAKRQSPSTPEPIVVGTSAPTVRLDNTNSPSAKRGLGSASPTASHRCARPITSLRN